MSRPHDAPARACVFRRKPSGMRDLLAAIVADRHHRSAEPFHRCMLLLLTNVTVHVSPRHVRGHMARAFLTVLALLIYLPGHAVGQGKSKYQLAAGWQGEVRLDADKSLSWCSTTKHIPRGTSLAITAYRDGRLMFIASRRDWRLTKRRVSSTEIMVDSSELLGRASADARNPEFLTFFFDDPAIALKEFADGDTLLIDISGAQAQVPLIGSRGATEFVLKCLQRHSPATFERLKHSEATTRPPRGQESKIGTAFFVSEAGTLLTNAHVVAGCGSIEVTDGGQRQYAATVLASDETNDLALLRTTARPEFIASFRTDVKQGENIYAFGYPLAGVLTSSGNFTVGHVTATAGLLDDTRILQISAPVQPGNSGGPLLDDRGNVVGVVAGKLNTLAAARLTNDIPQNVNFAIKTDVVRTFLAFYGVVPRPAASGEPISSTTLADEGRKISVLVQCSAR